MNKTITYSGMAMAAACAILLTGTARSQTTSADKDLDLNIVNERITETNFERSTAVAAESGELKVRIGVAVSAGKIDATLRGITGHVRFRASLGQLTDLLRPRRPAEQ